MKNSIIRKTLLVLAFLFVGMNCRAQTWSDMTNWFKYNGVEILAVYAHPLLDVTDYSIIETTSNSIVVRIDFQGNRRSFTGKYEIVKGTYQGKPYFQTVRVLADDMLGTSFVSWDASPKFHPTLYNEVLGSSLGYSMYGSSSFEDLSLNRKAAVGLFLEFLRYYD